MDTLDSPPTMTKALTERAKWSRPLIRCAQPLRGNLAAVCLASLRRRALFFTTGLPRRFLSISGSWYQCARPRLRSRARRSMRGGSGARFEQLGLFQFRAVACAILRRTTFSCGKRRHTSRSRQRSWKRAGMSISPRRRLLRSRLVCQVRRSLAGSRGSSRWRCWFFGRRRLRISPICQCRGA